jgi:hypothetical protein
MVEFVDSVAVRLADAGLTGAIVVSSSADSQPFGNAEAVFRVDRLLLRFVRDRGQVFLDIASSATPAEFFQYSDVEIALGWSTIDQVVAKRDLDDLEGLLARLRANLDVLGNAFSGDRERFFQSAC